MAPETAIKNFLQLELFRGHVYPQRFSNPQKDPLISGNKNLTFIVIVLDFQFSVSSYNVIDFEHKILHTPKT